MVYYKKWCGCFIRGQSAESKIGLTIYPCGRLGHTGNVSFTPNGMDATKIRKKDLPPHVIVYMMKKILGVKVDAKESQ